MVKVNVTKKVYDEIVNSGYDPTRVFSTYYVTCKTVASARKSVKYGIAFWLYIVKGGPAKSAEVNKILNEFTFTLC